MFGGGLNGMNLMPLLGAPNVLTLPYSTPARDLNFRVLWHETLNELIRYEHVPTASLNFDADAIEKPIISNTATLTSNVVTRFSSVFSDVIVTEIWRGQLSEHVGFFYELHRFLITDLDDGHELHWFPKDVNDKGYIIDHIDLVVGDAGKMDVNPISDWGVFDRRWLTAEVRHMFKIKKAFRKPNAAIVLQGV